MLTVTPAAAAALVTLMQSPEVPEGAGIRLAPATGPGGENTIGLMVVSEPKDSDAVVETASGVDVFVDHAAAETLDDQELDAEIEGDRVSFSLHRQSRNGGPPAGDLGAP